MHGILDHLDHGNRTLRSAHAFSAWGMWSRSAAEMHGLQTSNPHLKGKHCKQTSDSPDARPLSNAVPNAVQYCVTGETQVKTSVKLNKIKRKSLWSYTLF